MQDFSDADRNLCRLCYYLSENDKTSHVESDDDMPAYISLIGHDDKDANVNETIGLCSR